MMVMVSVGHVSRTCGSGIVSSTSLHARDGCGAWHESSWWSVCEMCMYLAQTA